MEEWKGEKPREGKPEGGGGGKLGLGTGREGIEVGGNGERTGGVRERPASGTNETGLWGRGAPPKKGDGLLLLLSGPGVIANKGIGFPLGAGMGGPSCVCIREGGIRLRLGGPGPT